MNEKKLLKKIEDEISLTEDKIKKSEQQKRLEDIYKYYNEEDKVISSIEAKKNIEKLEKEGEGKLLIKSRYKELDKIIDGFREGNLIVVSGPTGHGKTTWCQNVTENIIKDNIKSLWFSFEVPVEEFLEKFEEDLPLFYLPKTLKDNTMIWIEQRIIESIVKFGTKVVFIDHLNYIIDTNSFDKSINSSYQIGILMRELKKIAIRWKIAIFLMAHLKQPQIDKPPTLSDLRDSSFIAQESDFVIILWRKAKKNTIPPVLGNKAILSVQKNRRTGKGGNISLYHENGRLKELDREIENITGNTHQGIKPERTREINEKQEEIAKTDLGDLPIEDD